ncbi:DNA repair protein RAD51-like protein 2 [Armadillidium nasatum]|uniref:DNA repair protein RAD51-like protein 2 n=1 Tax=Armadillidium nasatum TaxID=96803 RepID=A0A5N5TD53_9CRUS|nr:DNA repair protein RAD51-like protein 2 [Armadillidium nasatum]
MSERKLASLDLGDDLQKEIKNANLKTVEDVLSKSFLQLMTILHLSADETEDLIIQLSKECLPPCQKGAELLEKKLTSLPFCDPELDSLLQGGAPGVGKTQFSYQLAVNCLRCSSPPNGVCFLDTELCFKADRVNEIIEGSLEAECDSSIMSKFHVFQVETVASFNEILSTLELFCIVNDIGLVIVDSIASLIRKEFSQDTKFERASTLASWAAQLKELADITLYFYCY